MAENVKAEYIAWLSENLADTLMLLQREQIESMTMADISVFAGFK